MLSSFRFRGLRSRSPSLTETAGSPVPEEEHPAYRTLAHFDTALYMGNSMPMLQESIGAALKDPDTDKKLDFIQHLKKIGVDRYVDLPLLVVVGDQSSGKSTVLQAITQLPFPVDDKLCTRFATEVALQRSAGPESITVQIKVPVGASGAGNPHDNKPNNDVGGETTYDIECTTFPFGSPEFEGEFRRVLGVVGYRLQKYALPDQSFT
jgi:Dynamin family